jgi:hypothetical protein
MLHNGSGFLGGTLSDPATAVNGKTLRPAANATYTTADGTTDTADAILLDGSDNSLPAGNYLATGTLNYTHGITLTGNVTLILADNCHMNVGTSSGRIDGYGIDGGYTHTLTITSETNGTGALNVYTEGDYNAGIGVRALTINSGNVTANTNGTGAYALIANYVDVTINGGTVSATATTTTGDGKHYKLSYITDGTDLGWYWGTADGAPFQSGANKAWLVLPTITNARFFGLPDFSETTSLSEELRVKNEEFATAAEWYTLDGRKLDSKPTKAGLYIMNGKKVVIK